MDVPVPRFHEDMRHSGSVNNGSKTRASGLSPDDGGDDVFMHWKELASEGLRQGDTVSYDSECDDRKGNYGARHCIVIPSGDGTPRDGGDDVFIHHQQLLDTRDTAPYDTGYDDRKGTYRASNFCDFQNPRRNVTCQRNIRDKRRGRVSGRASLPRTWCMLW